MQFRHRAVRGAWPVGAPPHVPPETYVNVGSYGLHTSCRPPTSYAELDVAQWQPAAAKNVVVLWVTLVRLGDSTDGSSYG